MSNESERLGKLLEDGLDAFLYVLIRDTGLTLKRMPRKSGCADFHIIAPDGTVVAAIEVKNHKAESFWLNSQGRAYSAKFIWLPAETVKIIVYTGCELRDLSRNIISKAGILLYNIAFQVRSHRDVLTRLFQRLEGLWKYLQRKLIHSICSMRRSVVGGCVAGFLDVVRGIFGFLEQRITRTLSGERFSRLAGALPFLDDLVFGSGFGPESLVGSIGLIIIVVIVLKVLAN